MAGWYKLARKGKSFDLNDGVTSRVLEDFIPPGASNDWNTSVPIIFMGQSHAETHEAGRKMLKFVRSATKADLLYLEYAPSMPAPRPVYGQGVRRYKIVSFQTSTVVGYTAFGSGHQLRIDCMIRAEAGIEGSRQIAFTARGGILHDSLGTPDDSVRGTLTTPATINYFKNPIHAYDWAGNWNFGWTGSAQSFQNKDMEYILYGENSAGLMSLSGAATYYQTITLPNTNIYCVYAIMKRHDKAAITSSLVKMFHDAASITTSFINLGNGWYIGYGTFTGVVAAKNIGLEIQATGAKIIFYASGFMLFEGTFPAPLCHGDQPGCQWDTLSDSHNSKTTRSAGKLSQKLYHLMNVEQFYGKNYLDTVSIRLALKWWYPSTWGSDQYILDTGVFKFYYQASDDKLYLTDGTGTISSPAQTFNPGDLVIFHITAGPGGFSLYKNGVLVVSNGSFVPIQANGDITLGSTSAPASIGCMTWLDFTVWHETLDGSQVSADYMAGWEWIGGGDGFGQQLNSIPWVWTEDGGVIDMYQDATHMDAMILGGISGDKPAKTILYVSNANTNRSLVLALNTARQPYNLREEFLDLSGTVIAGFLGGAGNRQNVLTTPVSFGPSIDIARRRTDYYKKQAYLFVVLADGGANLSGRMIIVMGGLVIYGDWKGLGADATRRQFLLGPITIMEGIDLFKEVFTGQTKLEFYSEYKRSTGSGNLDLDWHRVMVGKVAYCLAQNASSWDFMIFDGRAIGTAIATSVQTEECLYQGDVIDAEPGVYNFLSLLSGDLGGAMTHTETTAITAVWIIPRWDGI